MAFDRYQDYEVAGVWGLALVFTLWEWRCPARPIDRRADWQRDALALLVLTIGVNASRPALMALFDRLGVRESVAGAPWHAWPRPAQIVLAVAMADFGMYWVHRFMHTRLAWRVHKWHHSVEHLYWFSGLRTSLPHAFLFAIPQVLVAFFIFHFSALELGLISAAGIFVQYFVHSNLHVPLGPLEWIFCTPQNHRRHHARVPGTAHGNYGTVLSIWDRVFGTYVDWRDLPPDYPLGLDERGHAGRMSLGV